MTKKDLSCFSRNIFGYKVRVMLHLYSYILYKVLRHIPKIGSNIISQSNLLWFVLIERLGRCIDWQWCYLILYSRCISRGSHIQIIICLSRKCQNCLSIWWLERSAKVRNSEIRVPNSKVKNNWKSYEYGKALMFIDYERAFDSSYRDKIWETLAL